MCLCGTDVQYSYFVSPDRYQYRLQLSTDSKFCMQLGTPISMPTTRTPFIGRLNFIYQSIRYIISFQMMPPLRSFDDLDGKERGQKKTDDLRAMTTLGPRTLPRTVRNFSPNHFVPLFHRSEPVTQFINLCSPSNNSLTKTHIHDQSACDFSSIDSPMADTQANKFDTSRELKKLFGKMACFVMKKKLRVNTNMCHSTPSLLMIKFCIYIGTIPT